MLGQTGEEFANFQARLPVLIELERASQPGPDLLIVSNGEALFAVACTRFLAVAFGEFRFRVEEVYVARATVLEQQDDSLCLGREVGLLGQDIEFHGPCLGCPGAVRDGGKCHSTESNAEALKKIAAGKHLPNGRVSNVLDATGT